MVYKEARPKLHNSNHEDTRVQRAHPLIFNKFGMKRAEQT